MNTRAKQFLENYIRTYIKNDIKEIKKERKIIKIINIINAHMWEIYNLLDLNFYVYNNLYIICNSKYKEYIIYDKDKKCLIKKSAFYVSYIYIINNNNNIRRFYYRNELEFVYIFKHKKFQDLYKNLNKIRNDKYKANYRLNYICFL
jgi:hypothetical protein